MTTTLMYRDAIYEERIPFPGFFWLALLMTGLAALFLGFLVYSLIRPENLIDNAPAWYWLIMSAIFAFISWLIFNFKELIITVTGEGVEARYGRFKQFQPWLNIISVEAVESRGYGMPAGEYGSAGLMAKPILSLMFLVPRWWSLASKKANMANWFFPAANRKR